MRGRVFWATLLLLGCLLAPVSEAGAGYASLVIDAESGQVLHARNADTQNYPASLTKMMTLYMVFDALSDGRLAMDDQLVVSPRAASMPPSKLGLRRGQTIKVKDAILVLVTKSANDIAVVVAEALGGTESEFAQMMTRRARELGLSKTRFRNASGLPDTRQVSTARDMAKLARALLTHHAGYYELFSTESFSYRGQRYRNHNRLLKTYAGTDGIKTGYIRASGYNLVASAVRDGRRLIGVVFGGKSSSSRNAHMVKLLDKGFALAPLRTAKARSLPPVPGRKPGVAETLVAAAETAPAAAATAPTTVGAYRFLPYVKEGKPKPGDGQQVAEAAPPQQTAQPETTAEAAPRSGRLDKPWGIQVGAYYAYVKAEQAATRAAHKVPDILDGARIWVPQSKGDRGHIYQARLMGLVETDARSACKRLKKANRDCMVLRMPKGISTKFLGPRIELADAS